MSLVDGTLSQYISTHQICVRSLPVPSLHILGGTESMELDMTFDVPLFYGTCTASLASEAVQSGVGGLERNVGEPFYVAASSSSEAAQTAVHQNTMVFFIITGKSLHKSKDCGMLAKDGQDTADILILFDNIFDSVIGSYS